MKKGETKEWGWEVTLRDAEDRIRQYNMHRTGVLDQSLQIVDIQKLYVEWMNEWSGKDVQYFAL